MSLPPTARRESSKIVFNPFSALSIKDYGKIFFDHFFIGKTDFMGVFFQIALQMF